VKEKSDPRDTDGFFLNVPEKLDDPFPDLASFKENRPEARLLPRGARAVGHRPHGCLGALLALEEDRISLETLLRRMPNLHPDETREIRWYRNAANRGPNSLPLIF
jgi:cytochrome P450